MNLLRKLCHVSILVLLAGIFGPGTLQAQLIPGFTADKYAGCSPLSVSFVNTTSGASASAVYKWDFGNGNTLTTTNISSPVGAIFYNPRSYTVKLTVKDKGVTVSKSKTISVYNNPTGSFTIRDPSGCAPLIASFSSTSSAGSGTIDQYFWDFGDGKTLNTKASSVKDTFTSAGTYTPSLTVTSSYGCSSTIQEASAIVVLSSPTAAFDAVSTVICQVTDAAKFINASTGTGALRYRWDFGDGTSSAAVNPKHLYAAAGIYTVSLTVTNAHGCASTLTRKAYMNVAQFAPAFSVSSGSLCRGSSVLLTDKSTPVPSGLSHWSFGDGTSGTGDTVSHAYMATGRFTVTLVDSLGGCATSLQKTINISPAPVLNGFVVAASAACQAPVLVGFTDTSHGGVRWLWHFTTLPGDTSVLKDPSFQFPSNQVYHPSLTVTNASGCGSTVTQTVYPSAATADLSVTQTLSASPSVCALVTAQCSAVSPAAIAQYHWSFGDGTNSTAAAPSHVYSVPGTYYINLSFTTSGGCKGTAGPDTVHVYPKPKAVFSAKDSTHCGALLESFYNLSDSAAQYEWIYGDGSSGVNNGAVHTHLYGHTASYTMTLIASSPGCTPDTSVITRSLVAGPAPSGQPSYTCNGNRDTVVLTQSTPGASVYIWQWGDHSKSDTDKVYMPSRTHVYARSGLYSASIAAVFGSCTQTTGGIPVYVLSKQHALLASPDSVICGSGALPLTISGLDSNYRAPDSGYSYVLSAWQYGDGTRFGSGVGLGTPYSTNLTGLTPGKDSLRAIFQSLVYGCYDTTNYIPLRIGGPLPGFSAKGGKGCSSSPVVFTDASKGTGSVPIVQWRWDFGDSTFVVRKTGDTVMHTYLAPGRYIPTLTVTDAAGCAKTDSLPLTDSIVIQGPKAHFYWAPLTIQPGLPVTFFNTSAGNAGTTYQWYFYSDHSRSNAVDSVQHTYGAIGKDTVRLIALPGPGESCRDTSLQIVNVTDVGASFTDTTEYINSAGCPPVVAYFKSSVVNAASVQWSFGDGATAGNNPSPSHTYNQPGVYLVTLTAYAVGGDSTVVKDSILVKGPEGTLRSSLVLACAPAADTLHATGRYTGSYTWDFGDGTVVTTTDTLAIHTYLSAGIYSPALLLSDSSGCQAVYHLSDRVVVDTLHVQLTPLPLLCDTGSVSFHPVVYSLVVDSLQQALGYHWNFGTGQPGDTAGTGLPADTVAPGVIADATFDYTRSGIFPASLVVQSPAGCTTTVVDTVHVVPALAFHSSLFLACTPATDTLYATGGRKVNAYTWDFGDGAVDTSADSLAIHTYLRPGMYAPTLHLSDSSGCPVDFHLDNQVVMDTLHVGLAPLTFLCDTGSVPFRPSIYSLAADSLQQPLMYHWDFGTGHPGDTSDVANPVFDYSHRSEYFVQLRVRSSAGCSALAADTVQIVSSLTFHSSLSMACTPATDTLHATGHYTGSYTWDFGDGTLVTTTDTLAIHTYVTPGIYAPSLHLSDSLGCQADYYLHNKVVMDTLHVALATVPLLCDTGSVVFHPSVYSLVVDSLQDSLSYHWQFGTGQVGVSKNEAYSYTRSGIYIAQLLVQSPAGCSATVRDTIHIATPLALQYPHNTDLCIGDSAVLSVKGGDLYQWQSAPTLTAIDDSSALAMPTTTTTYSVVATDLNHCFSDTAYMQVTVNPLPTIHIESLAPVPVGSTITLEANTSADVVSQVWSPATYLSCTACAAPQCTPDSPVTYVDRATTAFGCSASDTVVVAIVCSEGAIHMPGGFTPNHDGRNDYYIPLGHGVKVVTHFQIYSRWGQLVYSAENLPLGDEKLGWDGTFNGRDAPVGTYVYMLQVACYTGETFMVKGTVELIR